MCPRLLLLWNGSQNPGKQYWMQYFYQHSFVHTVYEQSLYRSCSSLTTFSASLRWICFYSSVNNLFSDFMDNVISNLLTWCSILLWHILLFLVLTRNTILWWYGSSLYHRIQFYRLPTPQKWQLCPMSMSIAITLWYSVFSWVFRRRTFVWLTKRDTAW